MYPTSLQTNFSSKDRLLSLDILRGLDLFLLVFFQPVLVALAQLLDFPWLHIIADQFDHEVWEGFRFWDLVMPLFLFMTGISMPFSFSKYLEMPNKSVIYRKIIRRFLLLFVLGMVVQGNLLGLDPNHFVFYSNTLQAIASGYLIASMLFLHFSIRNQILCAFILLILYWLPMTFCGDFTPLGNFAEKVDRIVLGRFRDGVYWTSDGLWHFSPSYNYTWIWSTLTFAVTVLLGSFAGTIIRSERMFPKKIVKHLFSIGIILVAAGLLWHFQMPIIKRLWTASMTLFSGGLCFVLMALFYYWIDYKHHHRGLLWLRIYGMNSIALYMLGEVINFRCIVSSVSYGLESYLEDYYSVWLSFGNYFIVFLILRWLYQHNLFLKV